MCYNVLQCVFSTLGCSTHWGTLGFLNVIRNVHERQCVSQCVACGFRNVFKTHWLSMCLQCAFNVFSMCFLHIETHWNTLLWLLHNYIKNVPDYNVFQCVIMCANVPPMCLQCASNVFSMCFMHIGILPCFQCAQNTLKKHWRHIGGTLNVLLIAPANTLVRG